MLINPEHGFLTPGETAISDLTFTASDHPKCYQLDVICQVQHHIFQVAFLKCPLCCFHHLPCFQITQESLLTPYLQALQRWEEVGHQQDFSATDKKLSLNTTKWVSFKVPNQFWPHVRLPLASQVVSLLQKAEATRVTHPTLKKYKVFCTLYLSWITLQIMNVLFFVMARSDGHCTFTPPCRFCLLSLQLLSVTPWFPYVPRELRGGRSEQQRYWCVQSPPELP